jgi:hypothetical protein
MNRRPGTTLVEVLVAIFVMGIGMLALLTLFPLGAASMAQAIKDSRAAHAAIEANSIAEAFADPDLQTANSTTAVVGIRNNPSLVGTNTPNLPFYPNAFTNPGAPPGQPALFNLGGNNPDGTPYDGPTYAVLVDPFGFYSSLGSAPQLWVTGQGSQGAAIPRRSLRLFDQFAGLQRDNLIRRFFTLQDDILFGKNGLADLSTGQVEREGGYSWAYLLRRPRRPSTDVVDMSIVIYNQRPLRLAGGVNPTENAYNAVFDNTQNVITLTWNPNQGQTQPALRAGGWVLDATILPSPVPGKLPQPHGFFYRVTEVVQTGPNTVQLSCATPFKEFPAATQTNGVVMVLDGVAEVIEKRSGWLP